MITDERLTAYIDGELDPAARADVEAALRQDPELAARAERHRKLRSQLASAYAAELEEPVPERLLAVLRSTSGQAASA
ncbi:MAG TPA: zf-HC2 domain-containing protein, partial [Steroidobacteraceae bacterium]|nr:zf-HC2 domain-containing protein [Steroidobacteraceae bacterium]